MKRRVLLVFAVMLTWLATPSTAHAALEPVGALSAHIYDGSSPASLAAAPVVERGQPSRDRHKTYLAVDHWSHHASSR